MSEQPQRPLIGDTRAVFQFGALDDFVPSIERARLEQEEICGYGLRVKSVRQTKQQDDKGNDVYEVYATFEPRGDETGESNGEASGVQGGPSQNSPQGGSVSEGGGGDTRKQDA